ncbi:MAG: hypothetical protein GXP03_10745 [Alphaproteobacteria bacterium]|nr:hypothetical protein [Alphaproteobacteria bacterium]
MLRFLIPLLFLASFATAQESVVAGMSQNRISISANFDGSEILIFGAIKRETPIPDYAPLEIIIAVSGPDEPTTVRRKERIFGIWVNKDTVEFEASPSFYAVASTNPLNEILSVADDARFSIRIGSRIPLTVEEDNQLNLPEFRDSIIRIRENQGLYSERESIVTLNDETLFDTTIQLPSNLVEGDYKTRIFLTRNRQVIDDFETTIMVRKVGLERWIFNLAHERPLIYGLLSLTIAIMAGWLASAVFRLLKIS